MDFRNLLTSALANFVLVMRKHILLRAHLRHPLPNPLRAVLVSRNSLTSTLAVPALAPCAHFMRTHPTPYPSVSQATPRVAATQSSARGSHGEIEPRTPIRRRLSSHQGKEAPQRRSGRHDPLPTGYDLPCTSSHTDVTILALLSRLHTLYCIHMLSYPVSSPYRFHYPSSTHTHCVGSFVVIYLYLYCSCSYGIVLYPDILCIVD